MLLDIQKIRADFPILSTKVYNKPFIYFDNGATNHKPYSVLKSIETYYSETNSNVHRGTHFLSQKATKEMEEARETVQEFIGAKESAEIIFTRGTTESINLVATTFSKKFLHKDQNIVISTLEHHSNIVPWQQACLETGAELRVIPMNDEGELLINNYHQLVDEKTALVAVTHISNALGTINPIKEMIDWAHKKGAVTLIDGAQSIAHLPIDVQQLDCDFFCFSGHKLYGPTGIGILYGKRAWLEKLPPYQFGGEMIAQVTFEKTTFNELPYKFEAGTPNIADSIALAEAIKYVQQIGLENISHYEDELLTYATEQIKEIDGIRIFGTAQKKSGVLSFLLNNQHPFDVGTLLDKFGIAVRTGHHCTQPLMQRLGIAGTVRASFALYNTKEEVAIFIQALKKVNQLLS